ncbi:MAG: DUF2130 domain-containing protein [bacterium]|nr:DUF2130 domain-containing protein [bacterium]
MSNLITCPSCHAEIAINEVLKAQLSDQIRAEFESEIRAKHIALDAAKKQLELDKQAAKELRESMDEQIRIGVEAEKAAVLAKAKMLAEQKFSVELKDRSSQLEELTEKLRESQQHELKLRERERKLEAETQELKLIAAREVDAQRDNIRQEALRQFAEEHRMKDAEHQKMVSELKKQIDDLKRKAEQGSQQTQGEVQELALEDLLESSFPSDSIQAIGKGVNGGDALQRVLCSSGLESGSILWESKRTKSWSNQWLPKLRDDQRAARASCAVIVTQTLPEGVENFALIEGVWVCNWSCVKGLAMALRAGLIEAGKNRLAAEGRAEKMELVYNYLSGKEFQRCVEGIVEAFVTMRAELDREKRSMQTIWNRREKQIDRAIGSTAGMYGDLQGIFGASLPKVDGLALPCLDAPEDSSPSDVEAAA